MWMSSKIRGASARVWKAVREAAGWFSRGYFLTKSKNAVATMRETFTEARHNGAVSSGLARSGPQLINSFLPFPGLPLDLLFLAQAFLEHCLSGS